MAAVDQWMWMYGSVSHLFPVSHATPCRRSRQTSRRPLSCLGQLASRLLLAFSRPTTPRSLQGHSPLVRVEKVSLAAVETSKRP